MDAGSRDAGRADAGTRDAGPHDAGTADAGPPNPCDTKNGGCSDDATCTPLNGVAQCTCNSGFMGDGTTCTADPQNPCNTDNGGCSPNATCTDDNGVASCACKSNYAGDGVTCYELCSGPEFCTSGDQCVAQVSPPVYVCTPTVGAYEQCGQGIGACSGSEQCIMSLTNSTTGVCLTPCTTGATCQASGYADAGCSLDVAIDNELVDGGTADGGSELFCADGCKSSSTCPPHTACTQDLCLPQ